MTVRKSRQAVSKDRHPVSGTRRARIATLASVFSLAVSLGACAPDPEQLLSRRWQESSWGYEPLDPTRADASQWDELVQASRQPGQPIVRHEGETWDFRPSGELLITTRTGTTLRREWRLKGRGHVLLIRADDAVELYDVKQLSERELVLHYDIGMEARGIARLAFRNAQGRDALQDSASRAAQAAVGRVDPEG